MLSQGFGRAVGAAGEEWGAEVAATLGHTRLDGEVLLARAVEDPWSTTVPRRLVHRRSVAEVLLTALVPLGATSAVVAAQWARAQGFYASADRWHDTALLFETLRQAGLALCHEQLGVALDRQFLLHDLEVQVVDATQLRVGSEPARLVVCCELVDLKWRGSGLRAGRMLASFKRDGQALAEASSRFTCVDPATYGRLRSTSPRPPGVHRVTCGSAAYPTQVGRLREEDVLVCGCGGRGVATWGLRVGATHPFLFDHPTDHVPGMAVLEACRQAAVLATRATTPRWQPGDGVVRFLGLVPLDGLVTLEAAGGTDGATVVEARWGADVLARAAFHPLWRSARPAPDLVASSS